MKVLRLSKREGRGKLLSICTKDLRGFSGQGSLRVRSETMAQAFHSINPHPPTPFEKNVLLVVFILS